MIIPKLIHSEYYTKMDNLPTVTSAVDRLVFIENNPNKLGYRYITFDLVGNLSLTDKILAYIGVFDEFKLPRTHIHGPFYVGGLTEPYVYFSEWSTTKEFIDIMDYEFMRRKPMTAAVDDDGLPLTIIGRALDVDEFKHLYINEKYRKDILQEPK